MFAVFGSQEIVSAADNKPDPMNAVFRAVWTAVVIALAAFASRATSPGDGASPEAVRCESDPPRDVRGLEDCVARFPRDVELLLELGAAYEQGGRIDEARAAYRRAAAIDPRDATARRLAERQ